MPCYRPLIAWQRVSDGSVSFREVPDSRELPLPCGYCRGCRTIRARAWSLRCLHESQLHSSNSFITLTYSESNFYPSLQYSHFQTFMHSLRSHLRREWLRTHSDLSGFRSVRFFCCGEYGDQNFRPHFHALLFGTSFPRDSSIGRDLYRSSLLERLWPLGYSSFGEVTLQSARYVANYSLKKVSGPAAGRHYLRPDPSTGELVNCVPEFARMSRRPGLGTGWFNKYWREIYVARDGICLPGGRTVPAPRFYEDLLEEVASEVKEEKELERYLNAKAFVADRTAARLAVREAVHIARDNFNNQRSL